MAEGRAAIPRARGAGVTDWRAPALLAGVRALCARDEVIGDRWDLSGDYGADGVLIESTFITRLIVCDPATDASCLYGVQVPCSYLNASGQILHMDMHYYPATRLDFEPYGFPAVGGVAPSWTCPDVLEQLRARIATTRGFCSADDVRCVVASGTHLVREKRRVGPRQPEDQVVVELALCPVGDELEGAAHLSEPCE